MVPAHVWDSPAVSERSGVRRVRSSCRNGKKKSASSTVVRPFFARSAARWGPTPLKNWSGVASPLGGGVCLADGSVLSSCFDLTSSNQTPVDQARRSGHGSAVRYLREGSRRREHDQSRAPSDTAPLASESRVDADPGRREGPSRARLYALPQGRESHEGHLSTTGGGMAPSRLNLRWEAATPHRSVAHPTSSSSSSWSPSSSSSDHLLLLGIGRRASSLRDIATFSSSWPPSS